MRTLFSLVATWLVILTVPLWASMASIGKEKVNVRSAPNLEAEVLFQAHLGYPVELSKTKGSWVQIKDWQENVGWIYRPLVNQKVRTAVVLPDRVNIRKGPGLKHQVVTQAKGGEVYKILEENKSWVRIGYYLENEEVGWIRKDMVWGE